MSQPKKTIKNKKPNQRRLHLRVRPFFHGDVLIGIWEDEKQIALFNAPPEVWENDKEIENLLRYFVNQGII